jgi:poly(hydroxyalkanoate) depolymerase family esterase
LPEPSVRTTGGARERLDPPTIDVKATVLEKKEGHPPASDPPRIGLAPFDSIKGFSGLGLSGPIRRATPSTADIAPDGTRFIDRTFSNPAGCRNYKLFIPSRYQGQPLPLVVMLHGCTQSPDDFAAGTRMNFMADEQNCFVVYPEQSSGANQAKCWNWFRRSDQQREKGEPSLIAGITRQIMQVYSVDSKRVYVAGLSAGGAAAAIMGSTHPDLYAAVGVHSGLACGVAGDLPSAFLAMRGSRSQVAVEDAAPTAPTVPTIVFHGDRDTTVHPTNGNQILQQFATGGTKVVRGRVPQGHGYTRTILTDAGGHVISEHWSIRGAGHAWSGGSPSGSFTDPQGPDATREMLRFFLERSLRTADVD